MFTFLSFVPCPAPAACLPPRPQIKSHTQTLPFETEIATWLLRVLALHEDCMHAPLALRVVMSTSVWFSCCQTSRHLYGRMTWRAPPCDWGAGIPGTGTRLIGGGYTTSSTHMHHVDVLSQQEDKMKVSVSIFSTKMTDILYFSKYTFLLARINIVVVFF